MNRADDLAAFEAVVERWQARLVSYTNRLVGDRHAAEDLVQETLTRAWRHWQRLAGVIEHPGWLFVTAHRLAIDLVIARRRLGKHASWLSMDTIFYLADPSDRVREVLDRQELAELLGVLAPAESAAMLLWLGGLQYHEVAEALAIPIGTVKSRISAARARLRRVREQIA